jgi:RNase adapter protein RapZ
MAGGGIVTAGDLQIVVVSGLSGSGKSVALRCFEDLGFFCVDNLPPPLLVTFVGLCAESSYGISRVALGVDVRERHFLEDLIGPYEQLVGQGLHVQVLFLEAEDDVLIRRFSESRRPHPLAPDRPVREGIMLERQRLAQLCARADRIIDTSHMTVHDLKATLTRMFQPSRDVRALQVHLISFGYKYGLPSEVDLLFDARCLPNPYFIDELKPHTGEHPHVINFVLGHAQTKLLLDRIFDYLDALLPEYEREGKANLTIGIGCTGGKHRSVVVAQQVADHLTGKGYAPSVEHRDHVRRV